MTQSYRRRARTHTSRPVAITSDRVAKPAPSPWLSGPLFDLVVYAGSPLWGAALVLALARVVEPIRLFYAFNIAFTILHYGPTWLRVYADREERARHRVSIYVFPLAVIAFAWLTHDRPEVLAMILFLWDRWHAVMQNYGFLRVYDAKAGTSLAARARLDLALLVATALFVLSLNVGLLAPALAMLGRVGISPVTTVAVVRAIRIGAGAAAAVILVAWLREARRAPDNRRQVPRFAFLACVTAGHFVMNATTNVFLLSSQEKVYHALQYVALSWQYARRRATTTPVATTGRAFHAVFARRGWLFALAIAAWTAIAVAMVQVLGAGVAGPGLFSIALSVIAPCHYYFDSFLWRVRRPEVRANL